MGIYSVELYLRVRQACAEGMSQREAARVFNVSRDTVRKVMSFSVPPGYRRTVEVRRPKLDPFIPIIEGWLEADRTMPRKQRHTAKRVFDRLRDECGFTGGYTIIKDYIRERRMVERRIKAAKFPAVKSLDSFDFAAIPKLNKMQVLELARCEWIERRENVIALGPSGTGKTHVALGIGLAACQKGLSVGFTTAAALVSEMMEARDERRLLRFQKQMAGYKLVIIDELGFVPLSKTGAELLFELISQRYERGSTLITSNLPFDEWTETFGSERLTGALLDRLTHHVSILEMNGESYRLANSTARKRR